ncbi:MAG: molybdate ABC transporter substrate-binding protein [Acidobacteria bacterium]|nr:molybdate ABC transporter substrate-binding protein [Acidobacteriota bacterium]
MLRGLLIAVALCGLACSSGPGGGDKLAVAAASSLRFAMGEIETAFEQAHPAIDLEPTYGSSGAFFAQIESRAPFDVFLSADADYPQALEAKNLTRGRAFRYASGRLAVWAGEDSAAVGAVDAAAALGDSAVRHVAIANPRLAPYGRAAEEALAHLGLTEAVRDKLVLGDNVAQTLQFAETGAADVALVAESLLRGSSDAPEGQSWPLPEGSYAPIAHAGAILTGAKDPAAAEAFRDFLLSAPGQAILARYGFGPPES